MSPGRKILLLSGPEDDYPSEARMQFRLTYEGKIRSTNRDPLDKKPDLLALHKHQIRSCFHGQLKQLWIANKFLRERLVRPSENWPRGPIAPERLARIPRSEKYKDYVRLHDIVAELYPIRGFRFLPLVVDQYDLLCSLDILFLRRDAPGTVITAGDIDNRIKTVIDALRQPLKPNEFVGKDNQQIQPTADQDMR
jgi:hypothetical protein